MYIKSIGDITEYVGLSRFYYTTSFYGECYGYTPICINIINLQYNKIDYCIILIAKQSENIFQFISGSLNLYTLQICECVNQSHIPLLMDFIWMI